MTDIERAKALFQSGNHTCVLCRVDKTFASSLAGIRPMVEWIASGTDLKGYSAADKIVGKAAALLFALAGVAEVYAGVMSEGAVEVFEQNGIRHSCGMLVPAIINRKGDGICPMEAAVAGVADPAEGLKAVQRKLEELRR